jgi:hypothetical protein
VLTVSKNPKHQAQFHTIKDALDQVKPDMTIRILDDAIYDEQVVFDSAVRQSGVVLEAIGKARIRDSEKRKPGSRFVIRIRDVPKVTLRGLQIINGAEPYTHVFITGRCPGAVLQGLEMTSNSGADCAVELADIQLMDKDEPVVIQNCTVRGMDVGVLMEGRHYGKGPDFGDFGRPLGRIVIRNNSFRECGQTFFIAGAVYQVHVVGNKILQSHWAAVELLDLLKGTRDVLIANNTLWSNNNGLRIWDDSVKGHEFLACKNIRFQNNLVLASRAASDLIFMDHRRGTLKVAQPGDLSKLLKNPEWRLSNNWREFVEPNVKSTEASWIPKCYNDHLLADIKVLSRIPGQADFLKPPPLSPLSKYGVNDKVLPPYVGAVPPDGMKEWDWAVTWKALSQSK